MGHRDGRATLRIALRKIEPGAKLDTVVDRESDFTRGRHRNFLITRSIFEPTAIETESGSRAEKDTRKRRVESACDDVHLRVIKLPKHRRWPVVFEHRVSGLIFVEQHADWRILRGRELMSRHERGRNRIADVILSGVASTTSDLQQRAMIPNQEYRQFRTMLPSMIDTLDIAIA
jgi:hypothetical protein